MSAIQVLARDRSYEVRFESLGMAFDRLSADGTFVVTDSNVDREWGSAIPTSFSKLVIPPGESSKSMAEFHSIHEWALANGADRKSTIVAFGGGVIGDLVGFAASSYMRGVRLVQIPTTLLSQVDSSVGGKVAIDLPAGKNVVGAFYPPHQVCIDVRTLQTLTEREFVNGMAEMVKYGLIYDEGLHRRVSSRRWTATSDGLEDLIRSCIEIKRDIVQADEFETTGHRAILNFGHTVGHAIEAYENYSGPLHGEAISIGMVVETKIAERLGLTNSETVGQVKSALEAQGLPSAYHGDFDPERLTQLMRADKKNQNGAIAMSLVTRVGECKLVRDVPESTIIEALTSK